VNKHDCCRIARPIIDKFGLSDWRIVVDERPRWARLGQCRYNKKEIGISRFFLERHEYGMLEYDLQKIVVHEAAHALLLPDVGHRLAWKRKYAELLVDHFGFLGYDGKSLVRYYLERDRYCAPHVQRLIDEIPKATMSRARRRRTLAIQKKAS
jgi:hypothetical protein